MTRVLITGCRHWRCDTLADRIVERLKARYGADLLVVHGAATGVDSAFAAACVRAGVVHEPHPADWKAHGKAAGPIRNSEMVDLGAEFAIAVHPNLHLSKGTGDCVMKCLRANVPVYLIDSDEGKPRRMD
jgi:hypothetical protein